METNDDAMPDVIRAFPSGNWLEPNGAFRLDDGGTFCVRADKLAKVREALELIIYSPKNDDGTPWINGGMSSTEEMACKALAILDDLGVE